MIRISVGSHDVASGILLLPADGPWCLDARLDDDPGLSVGQPVSVTASDGTTFAGEIDSIDVLVERVRVVVSPLGTSVLTKKAKPNVLRNCTIAHALAYISSVAGIKSVYAGADNERRSHIVFHGLQNYHQIIAALCPKDHVQSLRDGTLYVGPLKPGAALGFVAQDRSAINKSLQFACEDSLDIWPGQSITDMYFGTMQLGTIEIEIGDEVRGVGVIL